MAGVPPEVRQYRRGVIAARYESEGSTKIAEDLGVTRGAVLSMAKRMGLFYKDRYKHHGEKLRSNNNSCDREYFKRWTPNMAYILGYISADGCINKERTSLCLLCHSKDEEIILAIHKELGSKHKITRRPAISYGERHNGPRTYCNISSKDLVESLIRLHGILPRKTFLDLPMPYVPDTHFCHYLRGYFDGDGHVSARNNGGGRFSFVATKNLCYVITNTIIRLAEVSVRNPTTQGCLFSTVWCNYFDLKKIYDFMYPEGSYIFLKRKRDVFHRIISHPMISKFVKPKDSIRRT